jgi:hypothetical protein
VLFTTAGVTIQYHHCSTVNRVKIKNNENTENLHRKCTKWPAMQVTAATGMKLGNELAQKNSLYNQAAPIQWYQAPLSIGRTFPLLGMDCIWLSGNSLALLKLMDPKD